MLGASARYSCLHTPVETGTPPDPKRAPNRFPLTSERRALIAQLRLFSQYIFCDYGCGHDWKSCVSVFPAAVSRRGVVASLEEANSRRLNRLRYHYIRFLSDIHDEIINVCFEKFPMKCETKFNSFSAGLIPFRVPDILRRRCQR